MRTAKCKFSIGREDVEDWLHDRSLALIANVCQTDFDCVAVRLYTSNGQARDRDQRAPVYSQLS
jgi:hypothetical protein